MARIPTPVASFKTTITSQISASATTIPIDSVLDDAGNSLTGKVLAFCLDKGTAKEETVLGTVDGPGAQITGVTRGLDPVDGQTSRTALKFIHAKKASIEITAHPYLILLARAINGEDGIDPSYRPKLSTATDATDPKEFISLHQLTAAVMGAVTIANVKVPGVAGETLVAGNGVYLDTADLEWKKWDGDSAASAENVLLGIAQGAGTDGVAITGGVLLRGLDQNQTGLSGSKQYVGNTAGAISSTPGTKEVTIGVRRNGSTTDLIFMPRFDQGLSEDEQDALAGTSGTPSSSNKYVTNDDTAETGASKVARIKSTGKLDASIVDFSSVAKFGGSGSDGALAISSGTTTVSLGSAAFVELNYTSIAITGTGALAFSNPHAQGTVIYLRSQGNVTITSSATRAIDLRSLGSVGGAGGGPASLADGSVGTQNADIRDALLHYGGAGGSGGSPGIAGVAFTTDLNQIYSLSANIVKSRRMLYLVPGPGGGGGEAGDGGDATAGTGGRGAGSLYIECAGAYNVSGTIDASGMVGGTGGNSAGGGAAAGGGGGAGGMILVMYNTLTSDTGTYTVAAGSGGPGGTGSGGGTGGDGGGGAGMLGNAGTAGSANAGNAGGAGGAGAAGVAVRMLNTVFA